MPLVPGKDDEIDVDFSVEEQPLVQYLALWPTLRAMA